MFVTLQNASSNSLYVGPLMPSSLVFKAVLKHSKIKFLWDLYVFFLGGSMKLPDFIIVGTNLWGSHNPLSKVLDVLNTVFLFVRMLSMHPDNVIENKLVHREGGTCHVIAWDHLVEDFQQSCWNLQEWLYFHKFPCNCFLKRS